MPRAAALAIVLCACGSAPSAADCEKLLDHVIELELAAGGATATTPEARTAIDAQRQAVREQIGRDFLETCRDDLPRGQVACGLGASSLEDLAACDES